VVVIKCPATGLIVETGISMSEGQFNVANGTYAFRCPACGKNHVWSKANARLRCDAVIDRQNARRTGGHVTPGTFTVR
jgi:predicted RNA-binding Zn-ribbon protein involved in translation (DUF1610 family)